MRAVGRAELDGLIHKAQAIDRILQRANLGAIRQHTGHHIRQAYREEHDPSPEHGGGDDASSSQRFHIAAGEASHRSRAQARHQRIQHLEDQQQAEREVDRKKHLRDAHRPADR
jgi:hypothetical protein